MVPAGVYKAAPGGSELKTAYVYARGKWGSPIMHLPGHSKVRRLRGRSCLISVLCIVCIAALFHALCALRRWSMWHWHACLSGSCLGLCASSTVRARSRCSRCRLQHVPVLPFMPLQDVVVVRFCPVLFERDDGKAQQAGQQAEQQVQQQAEQQQAEQQQAEQQAEQPQDGSAAASGLPIDLPYKMVFAVSCCQAPLLVGDVHACCRPLPAAAGCWLSCQGSFPSFVALLLLPPFATCLHLESPSSRPPHWPTRPPPSPLHPLHPPTPGGHPGQRGAV